MEINPPFFPWQWMDLLKIWWLCRLLGPVSGHTVREVIDMETKRHQQRIPEDLRLDPEKRLCPLFDCTSIKLFAAPDRGEMGFRVLDNCAEENMK